MNYAFGELAPDDQPIYSIGAVERMVDIPPRPSATGRSATDSSRPSAARAATGSTPARQVEQLRFVKRELDAGPAAGGGPPPARRAARSAVSRCAQRTSGPKAPRVLILLAERDPYAAEFAEFFLRTEGYEVVLALDADEAERTSEQRRPDLAVVELMISGGTGAELCRRLKAARACLRAWRSRRSTRRTQALAAGADAFLGSRSTRCSSSRPSRTCSGRAPSCTRAGATSR